MINFGLAYVNSDFEGSIQEFISARYEIPLSEIRAIYQKYHAYDRCNEEVNKLYQAVNRARENQETIKRWIDE